MANANDFAAHLIMVLPFLLYLCLRPKGSRLVSLLSACAIGYGIFMVLNSGSRGALMALIVVMFLVVLFGSMKARLLILIGAPVAAGVFLAVLPATVSQRLGSAFLGSEESGEAAESKAKRLYLLQQSVSLTFSNPLFGVGPDQFINAQGILQTSRGMRGEWQVAHNSYTQISSEMGIPGFLFFTGGILSTFLGVLRLYRTLARRPDLSTRQDLVEFKNAAFCLMISIAGFGTSVFFLSLAYRFHILLLAGCSTALCGIAARHLQPVQPAVPPVFMPPPRAPRLRALAQ